MGSLEPGDRVFVKSPDKMDAGGPIVINVGSLAWFLGPSQAVGMSSVQCGLISVTWGRQLTSHDLRPINSLECGGRQLTSRALRAHLWTHLPYSAIPLLGRWVPLSVKRGQKACSAHVGKAGQSYVKAREPTWQRPRFPLSSVRESIRAGTAPGNSSHLLSFLPFWFCLPSPPL